MDIAKELRSKFEADPKETQDKKDIGKRQVKKEEILGITRPQGRSDSQEADCDIEVVRNTLLGCKVKLGCGVLWLTVLYV